VVAAVDDHGERGPWGEHPGEERGYLGDPFRHATSMPPQV
jgi:hypothetical protein